MKFRPAVAATFVVCLPPIAAGEQPLAEFTPEESEKLDCASSMMA